MEQGIGVASQPSTLCRSELDEVFPHQLLRVLRVPASLRCCVYASSGGQRPMMCT